MSEASVTNLCNQSLWKKRNTWDVTFFLLCNGLLTIDKSHLHCVCVLETIISVDSDY